jgi:hypothetical protein
MTSGSNWLAVHCQVPVQTRWVVVIKFMLHSISEWTAPEESLNVQLFLAMMVTHRNN